MVTFSLIFALISRKKDKGLYNEIVFISNNNVQICEVILKTMSLITTCRSYLKIKSRYNDLLLF